MNFCDNTDVGANSADTGSTMLAPNSVMKNKIDNMKEHNTRQETRQET